MKIKTCQKQCVQANDFSVWFFSTMAFIRVESVLIRGVKILIAASPRCVLSVHLNIQQITFKPDGTISKDAGSFPGSSPSVSIKISDFERR